MSNIKKAQQDTADAITANVSTLRQAVDYIEFLFKKNPLPETIKSNVQEMLGLIKGTAKNIENLSKQVEHFPWDD